MKLYIIAALCKYIIVYLYYNYIIYIYIIVVVVLVALSITQGTPVKNRNPPCIKICTDDYTPVCAGVDGEKPMSFGNECVMKNYNCEQQKGTYVVL